MKRRTTRMFLGSLLNCSIPTAQSQQPDTPLIGWSSWNTYHVNINETLIKSQADTLVNTASDGLPTLTSLH